MNIDTVIHHNDSDGYGAAWAAKSFFNKNNIKGHFIVADYEIDPQDIIDQIPTNSNRVYFLDFIFKNPEIVFDLAKKYDLVIIDHHISQYDTYKDCSFYHFDNNKSGARLTWEYFFPNSSVPIMIEYIEDHDLWRLQLEHTDEICSYIHSFEFSGVDVFDEINSRMNNDFASVLVEAKAIDRYSKTQINKIARNYRICDFDNYKVAIVNSNMFPSQVAHSILNNINIDIDFVMIYFDTKDNIRKYSLRSLGDFDVSKIAAKYGGGGHKNAAGFSGDIPC